MKRATLMSQGSRSNLDRLGLISSLRADGRTFTEIAEHVGVSRQAVHSALRRKHKYPISTVCSYCKDTPISAAGVDSLRKVACRKCLNTRVAIPLPIRLASMRILARLTQAKLAQTSGLSQSLISILETGSHRPRKQTLERLFAFLNDALAQESEPSIGSHNRKEHKDGSGLSPNKSTRHRRNRRLKHGNE